MEDFIRGIVELCMYLGFYKVMCISAMICLIRISSNIAYIRGRYTKNSKPKGE